jgi:hypothetical protein
MIERLPNSYSYRVPQTGFRVALFFSRTYNRLLRPGLAATLHPTNPAYPGLRTSTRTSPPLAPNAPWPGKLDTFTPSLRTQAELLAPARSTDRQAFKVWPKIFEIFGSSDKSQRLGRVAEDSSDHSGLVVGVNEGRSLDVVAANRAASRSARSSNQASPVWVENRTSSAKVTMRLSPAAARRCI